MSSPSSPAAGPSAGASTSAPVMPIFMGTGFVTILAVASFVGSWAAGNSLSKEAAPSTASAPAPASTPTAEPTPASASAAAPTTAVASIAAPAPAPASLDDLKAIKGEVESLSRQFLALNARLDGMPKPAPTPDLKPIQEGLDVLRRSTGKVDELISKVGAIEELARGASSSSDAAKGEVATLRAKVDKLAESTTPKAVASTPAAKVKVADLSQAASLFDANRFAEAFAALDKLRQSHPDDARVWYYSALTNGFATNTWNGETEQYMLKGIEREKIGTPDTLLIDAAFADLPIAKGKAWLASYRERAKR